MTHKPRTRNEQARGGALDCISYHPSMVFKDEQGNTVNPLEKFQATSRYLMRLSRVNRRVVTLDDFRHMVHHLFKEKTLRQLAKNAGLDPEGNLDELKAALCFEAPEPEEAPEVEEEWDEANYYSALREALDADAYRKVQKIVGKVLAAPAPKLKADLYERAEELLAETDSHLEEE